jgi:ElaB/YqjD/DUF883 family membrane-anchored ribosome-binding protein
METVNKIDLELIQKNTKKVHEISSEIKLLQESLDDVLTAIDTNSKEYDKGKISRNTFKNNEAKLKKNGSRLIKKINECVSVGLDFIDEIIKQIELQMIEEYIEKVGIDSHDRG